MSNKHTDNKHTDNKHTDNKHTDNKHTGDAPLGEGELIAAVFAWALRVRGEAAVQVRFTGPVSVELHSVLFAALGMAVDATAPPEIQFIGRLAARAMASEALKALSAARDMQVGTESQREAISELHQYLRALGLQRLRPCNIVEVGATGTPGNSVN